MVVGRVHDVSFQYQYLVVADRRLFFDGRNKQLMRSTQMGLAERRLFVFRLEAL